MADLTYSSDTLDPGEPNNVNEVKTIKTETANYVNGSGWVNAARLAGNSVTTDKLVALSVTDDKLASPNNSAYKTIATGVASGGGAGTSNPYMFTVTGGLVVTGQPVASSFPLIWRFAADEYAVPGKTTKFRVKMNVSVGATSPSTVVLTAGIYPITVTSGNYVLGTVVTGSTAASSGLVTNTIAPFSSGDFSASSLTDPGNYAIGLAVSSISIPSGINISWELQYRNT